MAADDSLENLQADEGTRQLAALAKSLSDDPKTRKQFLKLIKEKNPNQVIPELDTENAVMAAMKPLQDELAKLTKERLSEKVERSIETRRASLREKGFSADDIKAIEEKMVKESIPNHDTAAEFYRLQRQAAIPTPSAKEMVTKLPVDKKTVKDAGGIKNWARTEAGKAIDDLKAGRVKLH